MSIQTKDSGGGRRSGEYGNTGREVQLVLVVGLCAGALAVVAALVGDYFSHTVKLPFDAGQVLALVAVFCIPPATLFVGVGLTALFRIRVADGRVQHVFLSRLVISDYPISEFLKMGIWEGGWGAVLHFRSGKIRMMGAHLGELRRLKDDLRAHRKTADA